MKGAEIEGWLRWARGKLEQLLSSAAAVDLPHLFAVLGAIAVEPGN